MVIRVSLYKIATTGYVDMPTIVIRMMLSPAGATEVMGWYDQDCDGSDHFPTMERECLYSSGSLAGSYECDINGPQKAHQPPCDCDFAFDMQLTYGSISTATSDCNSAADEALFYGVADYDGNGNGTLVYDSTASAWSLDREWNCSRGSQVDVVALIPASPTYCIQITAIKEKLQ